MDNSVTCTWKECSKLAEHKQRDNNGAIWASLCPVHHRELEHALSASDAAKILRAWVLASGGPQALTRRMVNR